MHPLSRELHRVVQTLRKQPTCFSFVWLKGANILGKNSHSKPAVGLQSQISESPSHLSVGLKNRGGFTRVSGARWISELSEGEQKHRAAFALIPVCNNMRQDIPPSTVMLETAHDPNHRLHDFPKDLATPWNRCVCLKRLKGVHDRAKWHNESEAQCKVCSHAM